MRNVVANSHASCEFLLYICAIYFQNYLANYTSYKIIYICYDGHLAVILDVF